MCLYILTCVLLISATLHAERIADKKIKQDIAYLLDRHAHDPGAVDIIIELARQYKKTGKHTQAVEWFKKASGMQPDNTDLLFETGVVLSWIGHYDEAIGLFKKILAILPGHYDAKISMARVLSWKDKRSMALALCEEVIQDDPLYSSAYLLKAQILTWNSDFDGARVVYHQILEYEQDNKQAKAGLASLTAVSGDHQKAIHEYDKILESDPDNPVILRDLGKVLSWKGNYRRAIVVLSRSIEIDPYDTETRASLARVYRWAKRYRDGIELQRTILDRDVTNNAAMLETALLYDMWGKYRKAIAWYEKAYRYDPGNQQINARLGLLYSRSNRIDDAIKSLQKTITMQENDVDSLITLGRVYSWKKQIADSIKLYHEALRMDPDNQDAYIGLGRAYYYGDNWEKAKIQYLKALEINPLNREASRELEKIRNLTVPHLTSRYDHFTYRNYEPAVSGFIEQMQHREFFQSVDLSVSPKISVGVQYKHITEEERDLSDGINYRLSGDEYAVQASGKLYADLTLSGKLAYGTYHDDGNHAFDLKEDKKLYFGYVYIQYDRARWVFAGSYSREPLYPLFRGSELIVGDLKDAGASVRYDMNKELSFDLSYVNKMFYGGRHRKEHSAGVEYILPVFTNIELSYGYQVLSDPSDTSHSAGVKYNNEWKKINYSCSYALVSESFIDTNTHTLGILGFYDIARFVRVNAECIYGTMRKEDRDDLFQGKLYCTYHF